MDAYGYCYQNPIKLTDPDGKDPITAIIDAGTAFFATAALSYIENRLGLQDSNPNKMNHDQALKNINLKAAGVEALKSYAVSIIISGVGTAKIMSKIASSKAGKTATEFITNAIGNFIGNLTNDYNDGKFNNADGEFDMGKLTSGLFSALTSAIAEAGATLTTGNISDKLGDKLTKSLKAIKKQEDKLYKIKNASKSVIENRMKKINKAQKELVKNISEISLNTAATETIETATVKVKKEVTGENN